MTALRAEARAYEVLERVRWGTGAPPCPHCGVAGRAYFLAPRDSGGRRTRTGAPSPRRVWKCGACRRQFSVLTGTVLAGSRLPIGTLVRVLSEWPAGGSPMPGHLAVRYAVSLRAARRLVFLVETALAGRRPGDLLAAVLSAPAHANAGPTAAYGRS